ncbi:MULTISPECIES: hypothetical protein [unclassified Curtobacterium]|uniref:hypothetical protein n=2 Tax=Curtobacterium TaxID=2034 RepID=UPI0021BDF9C3|nr:hypothetical protein [Curtobacterium sp. C2H10]MCT9620191.1 hypothetical protein [Curtobacterium sp. C2H10]
MSATASAGEPATLEEFFTDNGVSTATAEALQQKYDGGTLLDSMRGASPVGSREVGTANELKTITTFPDGSISVTTVERPTTSTSGGFSTKAVGNCAKKTTSHYSTTYHDCAAEASDGVLTVGMHLTYTLVSGTGDTINEITTPYQFARGGQAATPKISIQRKTETSAGPAYARGSTQFSGSAGSYTGTMYVKVGGDKAWTTGW